MEQSQNPLSSLETASKQHEESVVIELGTDRLIRWLGVYIMLLLAVMAKVSDYLTQSLACHPVATRSGSSLVYINFANTYCWSEDLSYTNSTVCNLSLESRTKLLDNPNKVKNFVKAVPYIMLGQAFLFSFPLAFWHLRVGARLVGHLKFMQLLLEEIFEKVKKLRYGMYESEPYDEFSQELDERKKWQDPTIPSNPSISTNSISEETASLTEVRSDWSSNDQTVESYMQNSQQQSRIDSFLAGDMKDRNFFSMLCYENFANLHLLPFIFSTFKLSRFTPDASAEPEGKYIHKPLLETMMYLWCDEKNLNNTFLLKMYAAKQFATSFLAFAMLISLISWFFSSIHNDVVASKTFRCEIPFESTCLLCTIKRIPDVIVLFALDLTVTSAVLVFSLWKVFDVRSSETRETAHFFDNLKKHTHIAFLCVDDDEKKANA